MIQKRFSSAITGTLRFADWRETTEKLLGLLYWLALLLALLNYGANNTLTVIVTAIFYCALVPVILLLNPLPARTRPAVMLSAGMLAAIFLWAIFQTTPLLPDSFGHAAWADAHLLAPDVSFTLSASPADDSLSLVKTALPFAVFISGLLLFRTDAVASTALCVLATGGGCIAIFALIQFTLWPESLLLGKKEFYRDSLTGVFINRNTAATFFGLIGIVLVSLFWRQASDVSIGHVLLAMERKQIMAPEQKRKLWAALLYGFLAFITLVALALTKSRAGITSGLAGLLLLIFLIAIRRSDDIRQARKRRIPRQSKWTRYLLAIGFCLGLLFLFAGISTRVLLRAEVRGFDDARFCLMPGIMKAIANNLPFGAGLSSFGTVFPAYRDYHCGLYGWVDKAHNVYAEGLLSLGLLFPVLCLTAIGYLVYTFGKCVRTRKKHRFAGEAGLAITLLVTLHSLVDFSLQISGFAMTMAAALAPHLTLSLRALESLPQTGQQNHTASHGRSDSKKDN